MTGRSASNALCTRLILNKFALACTILTYSKDLSLTYQMVEMEYSNAAKWIKRVYFDQSANDGGGGATKML